MLHSTRFGIIGSPVKGSMSPRLFTAAYSGRYPYDLIEEDDFETAWARFLAEYDGINITAPFKALAAAAADIRSDEVVRIGAANLAVKTPGGVKVYNTDYEGVKRALLEVGDFATCRCHLPHTRASVSPEMPGRARDFSTSLEMTGRALEMTGRALIVGCGGAGRAAAAAAVDLGFEVTLANRTPERALAMASETALWKMRGKAVGPRVIGLGELRKAVREADLVIYNIPSGIPELEEIKREDWEGRVVLEANYKTPVLTDCGAKYISGKRWLLHQADAGYELFTGEAPDFEAIKSALPF